jgi:hypothetical protein
MHDIKLFNLLSSIKVFNLTQHNLHFVLPLLKHPLRTMSALQCQLVLSLSVKTALLNVGRKVMQLCVDNIILFL